MRRLVLDPLAPALAVLLLGCTYAIGGLHDGRPWGNGTPYFDTLQMLGGAVPYRDFFLEYPPFALPVFLAPHLVAGDGLLAYNHVFKLLMTGLAVGCLVGVDQLLRRFGADRRRRAAGLVLVAVAPAAIGQYFLNRYDLWPAFLTVALVAALLGRRAATVGVLLGLGVAAKTYPLVIAPVAAVWLAQTAGRHSLRRAATAAVLTLVVVYAYFVVLAPKGLALSYKVQLTRHLETETLGATLLLAADRLGLYRAHVIAGNPGSIDLGGSLPAAVALLTSLVTLAAVVWVAWTFARRARPDAEPLLAAVAASVAAFVTFSKVVSPQYLLWLLPLVPLVAGAAGAAAGALLLVALVLTQAAGYGYDGLQIATWTIVLLLLRNVLLVALFSVLAAALRPRDRAPAR